MVERALRADLLAERRHATTVPRQTIFHQAHRSCELQLGALLQKEDGTFHLANDHTGHGIVSDEDGVRFITLGSSLKLTLSEACLLFPLFLLVGGSHVTTIKGTRVHLKFSLSADDQRVTLVSVQAPGIDLVVAPHNLAGLLDVSWRPTAM